MRLLMTIVLAIGVAATRVEGASGAQTPDTVLPIFVDYIAPPAEMSDFASGADAIVVVRIEAVRYDSLPSPGSGRERDVTRYDVRVIDTIKPYARLPANQGTFTVTREGGQHEENGRLVRGAEVGFEKFEQGGEYLLFLQWHARRGEFDIMYGPTGAYRLEQSGVVRPLGRTDVAAKQQGKQRAALLSELRSASAR